MTLDEATIRAAELALQTKQAELLADASRSLLSATRSMSESRSGATQTDRPASSSGPVAEEHRRRLDVQAGKIADTETIRKWNQEIVLSGDAFLEALSVAYESLREEKGSPQAAH